MALTPEKKVKNSVKAILDAEGVYYFMPPANGYGRQGIPDYICSVEGGFMSIETKTKGKKPTILQEREMHAIRTKGKGTTLVVNEDNVEEVRQTINLLRISYGH